jgi:tetratricopeptide (TPR) repeat protein
VDAWRLIALDPERAAAAGLPGLVAVPADVDPDALPLDDLAHHAARFAEEEPDHPAAEELGRFAALHAPRTRLARALAARDWDAAIAAADAVLALAPADAHARFNRAAARREAGDLEGARDDLDAVGAAMAGDARYHRNLGRLREDLGDRPGAIAAYREALELAPGDPPVVERLRALGALTTISGPDGPVEVDRDALADLVRRDLAAHDDDHAHLAGAARALAAEGQPALAATAAALALAVMPDDEGTRLVLVEALLAAKRPVEALAEADRHVAAEPASALGHELRAVALARLGRGDEARGAARRALELDPGAATAGGILAGEPHRTPPDGC